MNLSLYKSRLNSLLNTKNMYRDLFSVQYILKNSLKLNYHYYFKKGIAPEVMNIDLKITKRCNADCYFCYAETVKGNSKELTKKQILNFVNSFNKKKKAFFITGGEPFLRKDIFDIIKGIKKQGSSCGIVTNGTLMTKDILRKLINSDVDNIVFSLHGIDETNTSIIKSKKGFDRIITAISQLKKHKEDKKSKRPYIMINSVINNKTFQEFNELVRIGDIAGADIIRFAHPSFIYPKEKIFHAEVTKKIFGKEIKTCQYVSDDAFLSMNKNKIIQINQKNKNTYSKMRTSFYPELDVGEIKTWYNLPFRTPRKCLYLFTSSFINEIGNVYPCQFYKESMGNILTQPFEKIWNNEKYKKFRNVIKKSLLPACSRCCKLF